MGPYSAPVDLTMLLNNSYYRLSKLADAITLWCHGNSEEGDLLNRVLSIATVTILLLTATFAVAQNAPPPVNGSGWCPRFDRTIQSSLRSFCYFEFAAVSRCFDFAAKCIT